MSPDLALAYCRMIARTLEVDAVGLSRLLEGTRIDAESFYTSDGFIDWEGAKRLIQNACDMDPRPDLALQVGAKALPMMHGPMGMAAMVSANLRAAMYLFARFINTRTRVFTTHVVEEQQKVTLQLLFSYPFDDSIRFLSEAALASAYVCQSALCGEAIPGGCVYFNYPPPQRLDAYQQIFIDTQLRFDAPDVALSLPLSAATKPLPGYNEGLLNAAIQQCEQRLQVLGQAGAFSDRVLTLMRQQQGLPSAEACADMLHLSSRTLIRRLRQEGVSFQELRDQWLARRALQLLLSPDYTVAAVALALGYSDVASFRRAFHRWFGRSPQAFRDSL